MRHVRLSFEGSRRLELAAGPLLVASSVLAISIVGEPAIAQGYRPLPVSVSRAEQPLRKVRSEPARSAGETKKARIVAENEARKKAEAPVMTTGPLTILVNLRKQYLTVYSGSSEIARSPISSGRSGYDTPTGVFSIIQKNKEHFSNLYDDAPMPNMQRITWSGVALHAGHLPGYPASHGCVRLPMEFSKRLFAMTQMGTRVIVTNGEVLPAPFAHKALFSPLPVGEPVVQHATGGTGVPEVTAEDLTKVTADARPATVRTASIAADGLAAASARRTRTGVTAERAAEKARLADEVAGRREAHAAMVETLKTANLTLEQARKNVRMLKIEADKARRSADAGAARHAALLDDLAQFGRNAGEQQTKSGHARLAALEDAIDAKLIANLGTIELLQTEASDLAEELQAGIVLQEQVEAARQSAYREASIAADQLKVALNLQAQFMREEARRGLPVSVFISRRTAKLYVRQGFEPIFEAPVIISEPDSPLGTHVFTAIGTDESRSSLRWSAVTVADAPLGIVAPQRTVAERNAARRSGEHLAAAPRRSQPVTPAMALERIEMTADVRERIEAIVKPGSSVIISDLPASHETGRGTDFVLLTR